jgi:hypothetical protein
VQRPDPGIPAPGKDQLARASRPDELVVDHVRRHPDQGQITTPLPDDFVPGREGDEVREALHRHRVAVAYGRSHGVGK